MKNPRSNFELLEPYKWLLEKQQQTESSSSDSYAPYYGDVTELNTERVILNSVDGETLRKIAEDSIDLLGTSVAVYEKNGDYAFGMFSSGWCQTMDAASRKLCETDNNREALDCGRWLCHENCWNDSAKTAIESGQSTDIHCIGGINLYGEPIYANGKVIGAINIGYGTPPTDSNDLKKLSEKFNVELSNLEENARCYNPRPQFLIDLAKKRLKASAKFIGELVEKSILQTELKRKSDLLDDTNRMAKVGGWELDAKSLEVIWTDETYRIHEVPLNYKPPLEKALSFFHPDDRPKLEKVIQSSLDTGEPYDMELRFITAKGKQLWTRTKCQPEIIKGEIVRLKGTFQDISEQKKAEEELKESEKKLHTILDQNPFPIAVVDVNDEKILYWSQSAIETFGHHPNNVSEWYELAYPDPDYREQVIKRWKLFVEKAFETNEPINAGEYNIVCQDGTTKISEIYVQFIPGNMIVTLNDITERKKIEETLVKNESLFRGLFDNMTSGSAIYEVINDGSKGSDYIVKNFNMKSLEIEGKTLDQVVGKSLYDLRPTIDDYGLIPVMKKVWETGKPDYFPIKIYEDEKFSNYYENYIFKIPTGEMVTIYNDVTDHKNSEIALKKSEERFALAMEFANDGLFDWNLETNEIYYSPVWKRLLGYEDDELPNDLSVWEKLTEPEDAKRSWEMQNELINKKRDRFDIEFKMRHKNGHWVDILSRANAIFNEYDRAERIVGTHVDITEKKKAEKEIKRQKERAERYLNLAGVIFIALNRNGEVTLINKKGCEALGRRYSEVIGKNWFENFIPKWLRDDLLPISKQLLNGDTEPVEYYENPILTKNGKEKLIAWHNTVLKDETGNIIGHLSAGDDITEKRQMEEQLQQAQKMESIGTLAGGIAHEFNNILSIIIGNNELIMEDLPEWSLSRESCEEIRLAGIRARDIVKHLLTFSRQDDSTKKPIDIVSVTTEALKLIRATTPSNIEIRERISSDCLPIFGDATQIHQILINLCNNAVDALPISGGKIDIELCNSNIAKSNASPNSTLAPGKYIRLLVQDNGSGMDTKTKEKVFEPYFTTKDVGKGSGIGLAVVHGIIENHGGSIVCESAKGEGTTFTILFPAHEGLVEEEQEQAKPFPGKGECVLYVDDEPSIAKLGKRHLEALGYDAFSTTDPKEALEMIKAEPDRFDLVISDMAMPNIPGDQLISEILSINPKMPTMICSGYSSRMSEKKASEMGIKAFVMKPLNKNELAKRVRKVLVENTGNP